LYTQAANINNIKSRWNKSKKTKHDHSRMKRLIKDYTAEAVGRRFHLLSSSKATFATPSANGPAVPSPPEFLGMDIKTDT
jgi:hypothetical protein